MNNKENNENKSIEIDDNKIDNIEYVDNEDIETSENKIEEKNIEDIEDIEDVDKIEEIEKVEDVNISNTISEPNPISYNLNVYEPKSNIKDFVKNNKGISTVMSLSLLANVLLFVNNAGLCDDIKSLENNIDRLELDIEEKKSTISSLSQEKYKNNVTINQLNQKVKLAEPWLNLNDNQKELIQVKIDEILTKEQEELEAMIKAKGEEEARKAEEERIAKEKAEEEERKAKEKAEKEKYNTGITYNQLARNPEDYKYEYCKFKGKVLQVMEGTTVNHLRVAVDNNYDNVIYVEYDPSKLNSRILEDDKITIYGKSMGIYSYTTVMGAKVSIPSMIADRIDI